MTALLNGAAYLEQRGATDYPSAIGCMSPRQNQAQSAPDWIGLMIPMNSVVYFRGYRTPINSSLTPIHQGTGLIRFSSYMGTEHQDQRARVRARACVSGSLATMRRI